MILMGKLTISMAIFYVAVCMFTNYFYGNFQ